MESMVQAGFGGQYPMRTYDVTLTVPTGETTVAASSDSKYRGTIEKIEIIPGAAMATSATLKGYEAGSPLTAPDYFLDFTFPESQVEAVLYPLKPCVNAGGNNTTVVVSYATGFPICTKFVVNDKLKLVLASAVAGDSVRVRVYVRG